ncbi:alpha/beta hydrolase [Pseudorhodoferax sp. Leaf267]|uniref:alpha/beta hydrolase n=1 Tax=Pseudorhodoferax sp. Leaf267 TaxID=1736316 RepID=UPI0009EB1CDE|nr:alpha/beta hydrolase [Pseudorhodoferax sp. Leaf267]
MPPDTPPADDAQFQYLTGQGRPHFAALLERFEADSATASAAGQRDIRYGEAARETFDFFAAQGTPRATMVYFHAGYWQSRDKSLFRFIAPAFTRAGVQVALVNYPLCPHVSMGDLLAATRRATLAVHRHARALPGGPLPMVAAGHSAGGHIAAELGLSDWGAHGFAIAGVLALSGVYDLAPLLGVTLNANLGLDAASARRHSPLLRVAGGAPPALFAVGGAETAAFLAQNAAMHQAWQGAGNHSQALVVAGADHFSLLDVLIDPGSALHQQALALIAQAVGDLPREIP